MNEGWRHPSGLEIRISTSLDDYVTLESEWDALWARSEAAVPVTSHALGRVWWECYGAERPLVFGTARDSGRLVAAALFHSRRRGPSVLPVRLLRALGPYHTDSRNGLLYHPEQPEAAVALVEGFQRLCPWDAMVLGKLDARWAQGSLVQSAFPQQTVKGYPGLALIRMEGEFDRFLAGRSSNFRRSLRKAEKKIDSEDAFSVEVLRGAEVDEDAVARMTRVDLESWKGETIIGIAATERKQFFEKFFAAASSRGWSRLYLLRHEDRDIAFTYLIDAASTVTGFKMSYIKEFSKVSPGSVLLKRAVQDSFAAGFKEFDFYNYPTSYLQSHWSNAELPQTEITLYNTTLTGVPLWFSRRLAAHAAGES